jgi:hypothetical protein
MFKKLFDEGEPISENLEDRKYAALLAANKEVGRIMVEIDKVFANTVDRAEAEKIVLEKFAPQMDVALKAEKQALDEWQKVIEAKMD